MTQPAERRFVMEPRLDAEVETLNTAISDEATARTNADALKVAKAGDTMTGALVLSGDPTLAMHAATKQYVDAGDAALQTSINDIKQTSRVYVKNGASSLTKGTPVYITGADGTNVIIGAASNASESTSSKVIGLTETDLTANAMGYVVTDGKLTNIDTSGAAAAGDAVWLGVNGAKLYGLANKPVAPAHMVYLGVVSRKNANTGEIEVKVQNGFELDELHNVLISSPTNGQALTYDNATGLWKNATPVNALSGLSDVAISGPTGGQVIKYNAGTSKWINGAAAGGVTAADTAPTLSSAAAGDAWFDTNDGTLYVCYIDVDSTKQWVQVQANSALEASILSRLGALEAQAIAYGNTQPNAIINGAFDIWQRGTSFAMTNNVGQYTADRWYCTSAFSAGSSTVSQQAFTAGTAPVAGYEGTYFLRMTAGSTASWMEFVQRIEDVRTYANQVVTMSFWAKASVATTFTPMLRQNFGTGGSANIDTAGNNITLTTSWVRYTVTITLPSIAGKTIGAGNYLALFLYTSTPTGSQTIDLWGVQAEKGNTATAFRRNAPSIQAELAACQRYYYRVVNSEAYGTIGFGTANASNQATIAVKNPVTMRAIPTSSESANIAIWDGVTIVGISTIVLRSGHSSLENSVFLVTVPANPLPQYRGYFLLGSNNASGYIGISAEL